MLGKERIELEGTDGSILLEKDASGDCDITFVTVVVLFSILWPLGWRLDCAAEPLLT